MFGLFKSNPDRDFEFHKDRTKKLLDVAFDRFSRADQYMCGTGFGGEGIKTMSAQGAEQKGHSSLQEAMYNADKALKLCKGNSSKLKELWQLIVSILGRKGTDYFVHPSIITTWDHSRPICYIEFAQLSKKTYPQYEIPKNTLNPQPEVEAIKEDSELNITELAEYMISSLLCTGMYSASSIQPSLQHAKATIEHYLNSTTIKNSDTLKLYITLQLARFIEAGIFANASGLSETTYKCISCGNKFYTTKPAHGSIPCPYCFKEYNHPAENPKEDYKMELSKKDALKAYAKMLNTLDVTHIEGLLADDFSYESQMVIDALDSKERFLSYIKPKLQTISQSKATVFAEIGSVNAYGENQPCVILAQGKKTNLVGLVLAKVGSGKLTRLDLCIVPSPQTATRSGEYPI